MDLTQLTRKRNGGCLYNSDGEKVIPTRIYSPRIVKLSDFDLGGNLNTDTIKKIIRVLPYGANAYELGERKILDNLEDDSMGAPEVNFYHYPVIPYKL